MEDSSIQSDTNDNSTSNVTSLESMSESRRLLEDIGGQDNLSMFLKLLQKYAQVNKLQLRESEEFTQAVQSTEFCFTYAYQNSYLFRKFLELSPLYRNAAWFVQQYTVRRRFTRIVTLGEIMYVLNAY